MRGHSLLQILPEQILAVLLLVLEVAAIVQVGCNVALIQTIVRVREWRGGWRRRR
jgi:hypothetical protein